MGNFWSRDIPYENPEEFVTFKWFKKNIMCQAQPWICENTEESKDI